MYILRKPMAIVGMIISVLAPVFLPFLRVPIKGNWNLYQTDVSLFFITNGILGLCMLAFFLRKVSVFRWLTRFYLAWCVLGFVAVYFKINNYFGMKFVDGLLSKTLHLKWGWIVLFIGALILVFSVKKIDADTK
ncbi:hypothetical protein [Sphingobacterium psychroaquaticum]|uniref:Uncharacterized protein n=1 Tax=Sphingobacterium psychroaquaticum TaxID=561061 RepID=A0A1X7K1Z4_9SPHI|nr:hypothetical protein [Sphingobacterium psychroaquaticum]SMG34558.1 hypothetical protein SAMN05660862_2407 [Sphingobacterium psychroaquaticum]